MWIPIIRGSRLFYLLWQWISSFGCILGKYQSIFYSSFLHIINLNISKLADLRGIYETLICVYRSVHYLHSILASGKRLWLENTCENYNYPCATPTKLYCANSHRGYYNLSLLILTFYWMYHLEGEMAYSQEACSLRKLKKFSPGLKCMIFIRF